MMSKSAGNQPPNRRAAFPGTVLSNVGSITSTVVGLATSAIAITTGLRVGGSNVTPAPPQAAASSLPVPRETSKKRRLNVRGKQVKSLQLVSM